MTARRNSVGRAGQNVNGTLTPTTARTRSGCSRARSQTISAPQSWPTNTAWSWPVSSTRPSRSSQSASIPYAATSVGQLEPP